MPGPSDIRVNPFNNATNYVNLTERHIVPSVSPFVVRLNEVPEKQDPSNMQMYYVDDTTGQTTETALTEVAATPGAGEFRPDYSTNAFDDTSWNTGLIEFSSADAGKIIEVSYTATGTLAGVKTNRYPAWWLDRGDGSDGVFAPKSNTTISGLKQYESVFIPPGVTVTVTAALICCQGFFINYGTISATGQGMSGGAGAVRQSDEASGAVLNIIPALPGQEGTCGSGGSGGGDRGTVGAAGGGSLCKSLDILTHLPSVLVGAGGGGGGLARYSYAVQGGAGGSGGGGIMIIAKSFKNTGTISADGNAGGSAGSRNSSGGGGGGGGGVIVVADLVLSTGTITAAGGAGGSGNNSPSGSRGSDGIVKVISLS